MFALTGLRLGKDEQFSNWESRPLREPQILYAATDAYCLLDVFNIMKSRAECLNVNVDEMVVKLIKKSAGTSTVEDGNGKGRRTMHMVLDLELLKGTCHRTSPDTIVSPFLNPKSASEIKIVCDSMLPCKCRFKL